MAVIFSTTLVRLRILRRRFEHEQEQKEYVRSKVHHLNQRLSELLDQRTELLIAAQDQVALAQTRADLGAMAAGVIHDINNALTAIQMGWEGLEFAEGDEIIDCQTAVSTGIYKAIEISREFKSFLRPPSKESVEVNILLHRLITLLRRSIASTHRLDLSWGLIESHNHGHNWAPSQPSSQPSSDEISLFAGLSEGQLTQIIMNLIVNASDALKGESGLIKVVVSATKTTLTISVTDNGVGMSPELQEKIFDPFFTTKAEGQGTGLGLHVLSSLIKRIHGSINLNSAIGQGTTFTIMLPRVSG